MRFKSAACFLFVAFTAMPAYAAYFAGIGIPSGHLSSSSTAISRDGRTVVGNASIFQGSEIFRWTATEGIQNLGDLPGGTTYSNALGVSPDGSVVVGYGNTDSGQQGLRWDAASGLNAYGATGYVSAVYGLFDDTMHEFGVRPPASSTSPYRGFVDFSEYFYSQEYPDLLPYVLSDNKIYFAGARNSYDYGGGPYCGGPYYDYYPVRFTFDGQSVAVAGPQGTATGISADGSVVVGIAHDACQPYVFPGWGANRAFRWVEGQGAQYLGTLPVPGWPGPTDPSSYASGVSADGTTVVGGSDSSNGPRAFLWNPGNGMQELADVLAELGVVRPGWTLTQASGISADGLTVTGTGTNPSGKTEAWIVSLSPAPEVELSINLSRSPLTPVSPGQQVTYVIKVTNQGNATADGVTVTSTSSLDVTPVSVVATQGSCTNVAAAVCDLGSLAAGETVTVTQVVAPTVEGLLVQTVSTSTTSSEAVPTNNTASVSTKVTTVSADLSISLVDNPDPVAQNRYVTYTISVTNNGPSPATGVMVSGTLNSCLFGNVAVGATVSCQSSAYAANIGTLNQSMSVAGNEADPDTANNYASAATTVLAAADLAISMTDSPDPVLLGDTVTYIISATNYGPSPATGVTASGSLPSCSLGDLAPGASASCTRTVTADSAGTLTQTMAVSAVGTIDTYSGNNIASTSTTVRGLADLLMVLTATPDPVYLGQSVSYTISVTNNGPSPATSVTATGDLPNCTWSSIAAGATASCSRTVTAGGTGTLTQTMSVSGAEDDPEPANNSASVSTEVIPAADLVVQMTDTPDPVKKGAKLVYTLTVVNSGPSDADNVLLTDTLPDNILFEKLVTSQGSCWGTATVTCGLGALNSGASATVSITIKPMTVGTATNSASVSAAQGDPDIGNNSVSATTTVWK